MIYLTQDELSRRWHLKPHTLENMRWRKTGPSYVKIGGRVLYPLEGVEDYERKNLVLAGEINAAPLNAGASRIQARKASELSDHGGDSSLDTAAHQSGHPTSSKRRMTDA
jgi:hypothetical protein